MQVIAVTGGIGAGKSTASRRLAEHGATVLDVDSIARTISTSPGPVADRLIEAFGPGIAREDGGIEAAKLAEAAFASPEATRTLNHLVHPALLGELATGLRELELMAHPPRVVVLEVPLLVESPAIAELADSVLAIQAPEDLRVARCVAKGMDEADARARSARQASDDERAALADMVIVNDGDMDRFERELDDYWAREVGRDA